MCLGDIPSWLNGQLVRIGPGLFEFGEFEAALPMERSDIQEQVCMGANLSIL